MGVAVLLSTLTVSWAFLTRNGTTISGIADNPADLNEKYSQLYKKKFQMAYSGSDGVDIRSSPGKSKLGTLFSQEAIVLSLSEKARMVGGAPWIKVKISGWMVKQSGVKQYITQLESSSGAISANDDDSVNMRFDSKLNAEKIAHVYNSTIIEILEKSQLQGREWARVELVGWMAIDSYKGLPLLRQVYR